MSEDKWPRVIKRLAVKTGTTDLIAMKTGCFLGDVKLAIVKRRQRGVIRKGSTWPCAKRVTLILLRGICDGARQRIDLAKMADIPTKNQGCP